MESRENLTDRTLPPCALKHVDSPCEKATIKHETAQTCWGQYQRADADDGAAQSLAPEKSRRRMGLVRQVWQLTEVCFGIQSLTVRSREPEARRCPVLEKSTDKTPSLCPLSRHARICSGSERAQKRKSHEKSNVTMDRRCEERRGRGGEQKQGAKARSKDKEQR